MLVAVKASVNGQDQVGGLARILIGSYEPDRPLAPPSAGGVHSADEGKRDAASDRRTP
jgi:hypothetical protein